MTIATNPQRNHTQPQPPRETAMDIITKSSNQKRAQIQALQAQQQLLCTWLIPEAHPKPEPPPEPDPPDRYPRKDWRHCKEPSHSESHVQT